MEIKWNFPNAGGGYERGIADAGIETFNGKEIRSLAREICQNSLDAVQSSGNQCVHVEFDCHNISSMQIPGYETYKEKINKAYDYYKNENSDKTITYLQGAKNALEQKSTSVLRISDYNTTGLGAPYGGSRDGWKALTKIDGGATKSGDKAGAFGIGKNASFCNSAYRLVFYRTLNNDYEIAAQGVSKFISFPENLNDIERSMTSGVGYYGNNDGNLPVHTINELDQLNLRTEIGTDVFIYGFNATGNWEQEVICEILDNFLVAIYKNKLSITIGDKHINKETLPQLINVYKKKIKHAYCYYMVLVSLEKKVYTEQFHEMGKLKLHVLVGHEEKLNRNVLVSRTSGMKVLTIKNISRLFSFSAILEMQGEELNKYFREMENPAHDRWTPSRYKEDIEQAKKYHDELMQWVKNTILSLGENSSDDEIEVEGLSDVLQLDSPSIDGDENGGIEGLDSSFDNIIIQPRGVSSSVQKGFFHGDKGEGKSQKQAVKGIVGSGSLPAIRTLAGTRKRNSKKIQFGKADPIGKDKVLKEVGGEIHQPLKNIRIIKINANLFRASFIIPKDVSSGRLEIVSVGENGKSNIIPIKSVLSIRACEHIKVSKTGALFTNMQGNEKVSIEFSLINSKDYAMEVNVYEYN